VKITPEQKQRAAELVGLGLTQAEAAGAVGISLASVERLLREPTYRKIADDAIAAKTSLSAQVANVVLDLLNATKPNGDPDHALRQKGAELYAKNPAMIDAAEDDVDDALLPGVIMLFPRAKFDDDAPVTFSEDEMIGPVCERGHPVTPVYLCQICGET